jgi:hypothetical protein
MFAAVGAAALIGLGTALVIAFGGFRAMQEEVAVIQEEVAGEI